jgi:hypothetical protein
MFDVTVRWTGRVDGNDGGGVGRTPIQALGALVNAGLAIHNVEANTHNLGDQI